MRKRIWKKYGFIVSGVVIGALFGFFYWKFVGCSTGSCPITSSPFISTLWGAAMGGLFFSLFRQSKGRTEKNREQE